MSLKLQNLKIITPKLQVISPNQGIILTDNNTDDLLYFLHNVRKEQGRERYYILKKQMYDRFKTKDNLSQFLKLNNITFDNQFRITQKQYNYLFQNTYKPLDLDLTN